MAWKRVDLPVVEPLLGSNQTCLLPSTGWPSWAHGSTQVQRMWVYCPQDPGALASTRTTATVVARLLAERLDRKDAKPYNYDYYLLAQSSNGGFWQSPPFPTTDLDHHSPHPPLSLGAYPSAPPSSGHSA